MTCKTSLITDGKCDTSGDITFATVQTLIKAIDKGQVKQDDFGMLIVDECFPAGTKVNTPSGYKNIEDIRVGDVVYSYNHVKNRIEEKQVNYLFNKETNNLLKIKLSNGKILTCTNNHPIFVNGEYKRADKIEIGDELYELQPMWKRNIKRELHTKAVADKNTILQKEEYDLLFKGVWENSKQQLYNTKKQNNKTTRNDREQSNEKRERSQRCIKKTERNRTQTQDTRWKWKRTDRASRNVIERIKREWNNWCSRISNTNQNDKRKWIPNLLQSGYCDSRQTISNRNRRGFSHVVGTPRTRQKENEIFRTIRVESIEIQEQTSSRKSTRDNKETTVYNIGVEDNHNYFTNDILVHNCHRTSTNPESLQMFRTCIEYFAARYRLGLTATLHRSDGLQECITKIIGDVIYEIKKDGNDYVCCYEDKELLRFPVDSFQVPATIKIIETNYDIYDKDVFDKNGGTIVYARLISDLSMNEERNNLIITELNKINGSTIVLSDRVEQLKYLCSQVNSGVQIDGGTPKKEREQALEDMRNGKYKYLFASYQLAKEGLDVQILSNLVMASPVRDFAIVTQAIGRIQRPYKDKKVATVYDFTDPVGMLHRFFAERRKIYRKNNWGMDTTYLKG
jgi:superfamily II DNA or RNA helicase